MRSPRSVTLQPMAMPSRILNAATDFFARVTAGFWPLMRARSSMADSSAFGFCTASPTPMLSTIFSSRGTCMTLLYPNRSISAGTTSFTYFSFSRDTFAPPFPPLVHRLAAAGAHPHDAFVGTPAPHAGRPLAVGTDQKDVGRGNGAGPLDDAALGVGPGGAHVALLDVDALDHDAAFLRAH